jgi:predicted Zn-dependent protease
MFLNRGMLDAARTDGEVIGVMAHEISHVVLRHGTAQATRGEVPGGAIMGGSSAPSSAGPPATSSRKCQFGLGATF